MIGCCIDTHCDWLLLQKRADRVNDYRGIIILWLWAQFLIFAVTIIVTKAITMTMTVTVTANLTMAVAMAG